jgi:hypothetical protein
MATRMKTVHYAFPVLPSAIDNTLTSFTQITVYLPESSKVFKSVVAKLTANQQAGGAGNVTSRNLQCRLGAAAYTAHNNTNLYTGSGEDLQVFHGVDLTAHFVANWSGTSMTMDAQVQIDGTASSLAWLNLCVTVEITYEYDDTSATQVKTVFIPLNAPTGALSTAQPAALSTITALDTDLPEASKVYRNEHIVVQGNIAQNAATTDNAISLRLGATTTHTTNFFEGAQATDYWVKYVWECSAVLDESVNVDFTMWSSVGRFNHVQAYLVVTYEFDATANTGARVSLLLPLDLHSPMGGTTASDYQSGSRSLWIAEPGTITTKQIAFYPFWTQISPISTLNMRIGTGSFVSYTDTATQLAGSNGCMIRNDAAFTLARGKNELNFDVWRSDTTDWGWNISGFWIINYNCSGKPSGGFGSENHTIQHTLMQPFAGANASSYTVSATSITLPETDYYINAVGVVVETVPNSTATFSGVNAQVERLSAEGGIEWEPLLFDVSTTDPESGLFTGYGQNKHLFKRWPGDPDPERIDIETSRRWKLYHNQAASAFSWMQMLVTYHTQTFTVAGTVSGYADADGAGLTVKLHRTGVGEYSEVVKTTTTTAGGVFSFTWYDNTQDVFVSCHEDATHVGTSKTGVGV